MDEVGADVQLAQPGFQLPDPVLVPDFGEEVLLCTHLLCCTFPGVKLETLEVLRKIPHPASEAGGGAMTAVCCRGRFNEPRCSPACPLGTRGAVPGCPRGDGGSGAC